MANRTVKEKAGKGTEMEEDGSALSLEECLEGLNLQGEEEEDLDFSSERN